MDGWMDGWMDGLINGWMDGLFALSKDEVLVQDANVFTLKENKMRSVGSNFLCERPHWA